LEVTISGGFLIYVIVFRHFSEVNNEATDEVWYKRAVEYHYNNPQVPFTKRTPLKLSFVVEGVENNII
jgi:hypothetical protein